MTRRVAPAVFLGTLLGLAGACQSPPTLAEGLRARDDAWTAYASPGTPPPLDFRTARECLDPYGNGGLDLPSAPAGACVPGFADDRGIHVLFGLAPIDETSLAHEAHHWAVWERRGGGSASMDPTHADPTWAWEVDLANDAIRRDPATGAGR